MAKKKLNKNFAAAIAVITILGGVAAAVGVKYGFDFYGPAKRKAEGRELMLKGEYLEAAKKFSGVATRLPTDMEFKAWFYETINRQTSINTEGYIAVNQHLLSMLATAPRDKFTLVEKMKFDMGLVDRLGPARVSPDMAQSVRQNAERLLEVDPGNTLAVRGLSFAKALPALLPNTAMTSADVEPLQKELQELLTTYPDHPQATVYYSFVVTRLRNALIGERAINDGAAANPRVVAMFEDLDGRSQRLMAVGADESKDANVRGEAYRGASEVDRVILFTRLFADEAAALKVAQRREAAIVGASTLLKPDSDMFLAARFDHADMLTRQGKPTEAEAIHLDTVAALPLQWRPRLVLADFYSENEKPGEALKMLSVDLKPNTDLIGWAGREFLEDRRIVPLRLAFYRLQNLGTVSPQERDAEIARAQADFDNAVADGKLDENSAVVLQTRAALQEVKNDRTGAIQTLTRAVQGEVPDKLKVRLMQQLVSLNMTINQPGAAANWLEQIIALNRSGRADTDTVAALIRLVDMRIRAGENAQARTLLDQLKRSLPNNPAVLALEIKLATDPAQRREMLAKLPENDLREIILKLKFAAEIDDDATVRRIAKEQLAKDPGALEVSLLYADFLRRRDQKDEALAVLEAARVKNPDNRNVALLTEAVRGVDTAKVVEQFGTPLESAMFSADKLRLEGDLKGYLEKLLEAQKLDSNPAGQATERLFLYYLATNDVPNAEAQLQTLEKGSGDPSQIRAHRIRMSLLRGQFNEAFAAAQALTVERPSFAGGWTLRGQAQLALNQATQAVTSFEAALALQPENTEALRGVIEAADRAGRPDTLKRYLDEGLRVSKDDPYFADAALRYEMSYGDAVKTIEPRLKQRDAKPDEPQNWISLAQSYAMSSVRAGEKGDRVAAADYKAKSLQVIREATNKFPDIAGFRLEAAGQLAQTGEKEAALKLIDEMGEHPTFSQNPQVLAMRADFYVSQGKLDPALDALKKAVELKKDDDGLRIKLASLLADANQIEPALAVLDQASDSPSIRELRLRVLLAADRVDEADKFISAALEKERSLPNVLMMSMIRDRQGRAADAMKLADEAVAQSSDSAAARWTRARLALAERPTRNNDVIADLQVVKRVAPNNIEARLILADRLYAIGKTGDATGELEALQRDFPGSPQVVTQLVQAYARDVPPRFAQIDRVFAEAKKRGLDTNAPLLALESQIAFRRGDTKRAVEIMGKAAAAAPNDIGIYRQFLGTLIRAGENQAVVAEIDRLQKQNETLYWTHLIKGTALHRLKQEDQARASFDRAMSLAKSLNESEGPIDEVATNYAIEYGAENATSFIRAHLSDNTQTQVLVMRLLMAGGKVDQAIAEGEKMMAGLNQMPQPAQLQLLGSLGNAYLSAVPQKPAQAQAMFQKMNEIEPNNMMTLNNLAYAMSLQGSGATIQDALAIAKTANELSNRNASPNAYIMDTYGWILVQANQADEGLQVLRQALEVQKLPEIQYHIGEALIIKQERDAAIRSLQDALTSLATAKQAGNVVDSSLEDRINSAMRRAQEIIAPQ
jgi:tetratricopeptide (TPR) repeat protein